MIKSTFKNVAKNQSSKYPNYNLKIKKGIFI